MIKNAMTNNWYSEYDKRCHGRTTNTENVLKDVTVEQLIQQI